MRTWRGTLLHVFAFCTLGGSSGLQAHELEPPQEIRAGCSSATDGCRVCKIGESGDLSGISCLPVAWQCNETRGALAPQPDAPKVDAAVPTSK